MNNNKRKNKSISCQVCDEEDNMEMVQCDNCDKWSHYSCAEVGPEIKHFDWLCHRCKSHELCTDSSIGIVSSDEERTEESTPKKLAKLDLPSMVLKNTENPIILANEDCNKPHTMLPGTRKKESRLPAPLRTDKRSQPIVVRKPIGRLTAPSTSRESEIKNLTEQVSNLNMRVDQLTNELSKMTSEIVELKEKSTNKLVPKNQTLISECEVLSEHQKLTLIRALLCKTIEELKVLEDILNNSNNFIFLQDYLSCIGGRDMTICFMAIFNKIISPKLQAQLSLTGLRTKKESLDQYENVMNLIHLSTKDNFKDYKFSLGRDIISLRILKNA